MADAIGLTFGTALTWQDSGGDYALTFASMASTAARQGAKGDLGANAPQVWAAQLAVDTATAMTAGGLISVYFGWSSSGTAGTGNPAGLSGTDAAYTGYSSNLADSILELGAPVIALPITAVATQLHISNWFLFRARARYVSPLVYNQGSQALSSDTVQYLTLAPLYDTAITI